MYQASIQALSKLGLMHQRRSRLGAEMENAYLILAIETLYP